MVFDTQDEKLDVLGTKAEENQRGWAAVLLPYGVADVFGALRRSPRLHRTRRAARDEAQRWIEDLRIDPISWKAIDHDHITIGRNRSYVVVIYSILLPTEAG